MQACRSGAALPPQKRRIRLDRKFLLSDREGMIHASAAQYYWFSFPIIRADGGTRVV
jgi:hypothetical protein